MTDAFETHLEELFAVQPDLPDAIRFASRVEHELDRGFRRLMLVGIALGVIAVGLTVPILGGFLAHMTEKATQALQQTQNLSPNASLPVAAGMVVVGCLAVLFGRHQASRL
jgi:uncharacterized membrane protein